MQSFSSPKFFLDHQQKFFLLQYFKQTVASVFSTLSEPQLPNDAFAVGLLLKNLSNWFFKKLPKLLQVGHLIRTHVQLAFTCSNSLMKYWNKAIIGNNNNKTELKVEKWKSLRLLRL